MKKNILFSILTLALGFSTYANECNTANLVTMSCGGSTSFTGSTVGGTPNGLPTCGTSTGTGGADWFQVTGDGGTWTASTVNPGTNYDTKLWVFEGTCGALVCVTGNDDFGGVQSQVSFTANLGVNYYIIVGGFSANEGLYELSINSATTNCGEECVSAIPVALTGCTASLTLNGSTIGGTPNGQPFCGTSTGTGGADWFQVTGDGGTWTVSTVNPGTNYDTKLWVFSGVCGTLTCVTGNDDFVGVQSQVSFTANLGVNYYIIVGGFSANEGFYELSISSSLSPANTGTDTQIACDSLTWTDGVTYTTNNTTALDTFTNVAGCDSVVTLNLTINNSTTATDTRAECGSLTWIDGVTYTANNNTATFNMVGGAANGCDSLVTLDLTINNSTTGTDTRGECDSLTWIDGVTYTANNNTATFNIVAGAANGCDSLVTLDLTIINSTTGTDTRAACDSLSWIDGVTYTANNNTATFNMVGGAANGCDSLVTLDLTIDIIDLTVTNSSPTLTANQAGATYRWLDCDSNNTVITGETAQSFTATTNGNYAVEVTFNSCLDTSACENVLNIGINENSASKSVSIYPNPNNGIFTLNVKANNVSIKVMNTQGQVILSKNILNNKEQIDLSNNAKGIYFVTVTSDKGVSTQKVIVQ